MELTTFWFIAIAVLWAGYFMLEGFDFGIGMLMPILGRSADPQDAEKRKRVLLNTIGPVWDGNEVWVVTAAGATFAAFPVWYGTMFSGFYVLVLVILVALILRNVAFDYRHKRDNDTWRSRWDLAILAGSVLPSFLWGVVLTDIVRGLPIDAAGEYVGSLGDLFGPVGLLGGVTAVVLFLAHGALFAALKTSGFIQQGARKFAGQVGVVALVLVVVLLIVLGTKSGTTVSWITSALAVAGIVAGLVANQLNRNGWAFAGTFVAVGLVFATYFLILFPNVMPSTLNPAWSLTTTNAASSAYTLKIMTWIAVIFLPVVIAYQTWTYHVFRKRIGVQHIPAAAGH